MARNAQRKAETERMAKAARDRASKARATGAAGSGGGEAGVGGAGGANPSFGGNPLGGGGAEGWEFDDSRKPAFGEQRLNSQVLGFRLRPFVCWYRFVYCGEYRWRACRGGAGGRADLLLALVI